MKSCTMTDDNVLAEPSSELLGWGTWYLPLVAHFVDKSARWMHIMKTMTNLSKLSGYVACVTMELEVTGSELTEGL